MFLFLNIKYFVLACKIRTDRQETRNSYSRVCECAVASPEFDRGEGQHFVGGPTQNDWIENILHEI